MDGTDNKSLKDKLPVRVIQSENNVSAIFPTIVRPRRKNARLRNMF